MSEHGGTNRSRPSALQPPIPQLSVCHGLPDQLDTRDLQQASDLEAQVTDSALNANDPLPDRASPARATTTGPLLLQGGGAPMMTKGFAHSQVLSPVLEDLHASSCPHPQTSTAQYCCRIKYFIWATVKEGIHLTGLLGE